MRHQEESKRMEYDAALKYLHTYGIANMPPLVDNGAANDLTTTELSIIHRAIVEARPLEKLPRYLQEAFYRGFMAAETQYQLDCTKADFRKLCEE